MSFDHRGRALVLAALAGLLLQGTCAAGELERRLAQPASAASSLWVGGEAPERARAADPDRVVLGDLRLVEEFHPETDRWTERTNRIRITAWQGLWAFSNDLDIRHDYVLGLRLNWEVPGFIAIRLDSGFVPWSRLEVKLATANNGRSSRHMSGVVHSHHLGLGIFNPELSIDGLAFWAGFGMGLWFFNYNENDIVQGVDGDWQETAFGAHIFVELDYKISDIMHVGLGLRFHALNADWTNDGRFYDLNGASQANALVDRNDGILDDLSVVTELTLNFSVLF